MNEDLEKKILEKKAEFDNTLLKLSEFYEIQTVLPILQHFGAIGAADAQYHSIKLDRDLSNIENIYIIGCRLEERTKDFYKFTLQCEVKNQDGQVHSIDEFRYDTISEENIYEFLTDWYEKYGLWIEK